MTKRNSPAGRKYDGLKKAVKSAGYFSTYDPRNLFIVASKKERVGLTGVTFWVSKRGRLWFVGAWGGFIYRILEGTPIEAVVIDALRSHRGTPSDFNPEFKARYGLIEVTDEDFDRA